MFKAVYCFYEGLAGKLRLCINMLYSFPYTVWRGRWGKERTCHLNCLPRGRHSEAAHEKRLLCAQKCTRGGVGWGGSWRGGVGHVGVGWGGVGASWRGGVGWVMKGWGGVGHVGVGWGGVGCGGCIIKGWGWGASCRGGVGWVMKGVGWVM